MASEPVDFIGSFATDTLASNHVKNRGWDTNGDGTGNPRSGMIYFNSVLRNTRIWDGSAWVPHFDPIAAKQYNTVLQTVGTASFATMVHNTSVYDTDSIFSSNIYTVPTNGGGVYIVQGAVTWVANATGHRNLVIRVNGSTRVQNSLVAIPGAFSTRCNVFADMKLSAGDTVDIRIWQNSGGNLNTVPGIQNVWSSMRYVGKG